MVATKEVSVYNQIINSINKYHSVAIISHEKPDGDCLGSQLALGLALDSMGKKVFFLNRDSIPTQYEFLPGNNRISDCLNEAIANSIVIFVDCADDSRAGFDGKLFKDSIVINIDHHVSNNNFGNINWVDPDKAATGEMIYELIKLLNVEITPDIATCLYTAISTDTGSFIYSNTTAYTHQIAAEMLRYGAMHDSLRINYYENKPLSRLLLLQKSLQSLKIIENGTVAYMTLSLKDFQDAQAGDEDTDGLVNNIKSISGVETAILFREINHDTIKIGFRSKNWFDVNKLASHFGGGGHVRAAGATVKDSLDSCVEKVIAKAIDDLRIDEK